MSEALLASTPETIGDLEREIISLQNDLFRRSWPNASVPGRFIIDPSIGSRPGRFQVACLEAVRHFDDFSCRFDPQGTHQVGVLTVDGVSIRFEIALNAPSGMRPSEEPADIDKTTRVLVIALAASGP